MEFPAPLFQQVTQLFKRMDRAYDRAAEKSGFTCNGCKDNCCLTRFYHHTLLELLYLKSGLMALPAAQRQRIKKLAGTVVRQMSDMEACDQPVRVMCPLNEAERCILYAHRPMICRLHGIPHALRRPDGQVQSGPGCDDFNRQCPHAHGMELDRTPLYVEMAKIERELRSVLGYTGKIRMTIAEMVISDGFKF